MTRAAFTNVTITGTNFNNVTGITFAGIPAAGFKVLSATEIMATALPDGRRSPKLCHRRLKPVSFRAQSYLDCEQRLTANFRQRFALLILAALCLERL